MRMIPGHFNFLNILLLIFGYLTLIYACSNQKQSKIKMGTGWIEGNFIQDSIFDGVINFYDSSQKLVSSKEYSKGILNGPSMNFFPNGHTLDSVNYFHGLKSGCCYSFEALGRIKHIEYYVNGLKVGPRINYKDGKPLDFSFTDFEMSALYQARYDSTGKISDVSGQLENMHIYVNPDGKNACGVFAYLIHPPTMHVEYSLLIKNQKINFEEVIAPFDDSRVYIDTLLECATNGYKYYFMGEYFNDSNKVKSVILNELNFTEK